MSFGFVQLMLDNTVRNIKPQFESDLFSCFYLKDSGKGSLSHCEDFSWVCSVAIHKLAFVSA